MHGTHSVCTLDSGVDLHLVGQPECVATSGATESQH
jgi:hypothetical protein